MMIFLVEDSPDIRDRLRILISEVAGADVVAEADNQEDAVRGIFETQPDVVIMDLHLASGTGMEVLRQVKTKQPAIQVVMLTNHAYPQYRKRCIELGADYFLDKSRDIGLLGDLLADLANGVCLYKKCIG
ncbi:response regulator transcription factor [Sulfuricella sp.]|uniref:response regulator n=1 Tax=Sulfuricella sp. TaxID=2099377 RepID=UPI002B71D09D|nr:response regulator transcription factor [Sulfuricella sp.]HUX64767.1 response regulator transcription factor [Sulfuricella sp.]